MSQKDWFPVQGGMTRRAIRHLVKRRSRRRMIRKMGSLVAVGTGLIAGFLAFQTSSLRLNESFALLTDETAVPATQTFSVLAIFPNEVQSLLETYGRQLKKSPSSSSISVIQKELNSLKSDLQIDVAQIGDPEPGWLTTDINQVMDLQKLASKEQTVQQSSIAKVSSLQSGTSTEATSTEATSTEATSTEATSTEATSTEATSTEATSTEATSTEATSTEATSTEATSTEATSTEATSTGSTTELPQVQQPTTGSGKN